MNANYAEICREGTDLEADFYQAPPVQFFWNFYNIIMKYQ